MANRQRIRPSRAELTDDLDAALEAFHAEPSAKLYRGAPPTLGQHPLQPQPSLRPHAEPLEVHEEPEPSLEPHAAPKKPQSKFKLMMAAKRQACTESARPKQTADSQSANPLALVGEIQERPAVSDSAVSVPEPTPSSHPPNFGFPMPAHLETALDQEQEYLSSAAREAPAVPTQKRHFSSAIEEAADADANAMLAAMSPDDIRKEQQELREQLDPAFIDILLSRRNKQQHTTQDPVQISAVQSEPKLSEEAPQEIHPTASSSQAPTDPETPLFDRLGHKHLSHASSSGSTHAHDISSSKSVDAWLGQTRSAVSQQRASALSALSAIVRQQWMDKSLIAAHLKLLSCAATCLATNSHLTVLSAATELLQAIHARTTASTTDGQGPERAQEILLTLESRDELSPLDALAKAFHPKSSPLPRPLKASVSLFIESLVCSERTPGARKSVMEHPSLLQAMVQSAFAIQWPPSSDDPDEDPYPDLAVLRILHDLSRDRDNLETVLQLRPVELLARFLVIPYWTVEQASAVSTAKALTSALMDLLSVWAAFGIGCELRASLAAVWTPFELRQWDLSTEHSVAVSWFRLLRSWITAATAPHETSPEHSIIWTQVDGWRELLQDAAEPVLAYSGEGYREVQAEYLLAVSRFEKGRRKFNASSKPLKMPSVDLSTEIAAFCSGPNRSRAEWLFAAITATETYNNDSLRHLSQNADNAVDTLQQSAATYGRVTVPLLLQLSPLCSNPLMRTIELCALCDASEVHYLSVFSTLAPSMDAQQGPQWVDVLRPFMTQTSQVVPYVPIASSFKRNQTVPIGRGPPLGPCWYLDLPMNELFDSATSKILREVPQAYPYGEVEIASSALQAQMAATKLLSSKPDSMAIPSREAMLYHLMRVFLLENHESRPGFFSSEVATVFRATEVVTSIREALDFLPSLQSIGKWPVELHVLYSLYGDLLELYEAASFSDALFGALILLIALEPSTPADFRQLLFIEHSSILSSLRVPTVPLPSKAPDQDPVPLRQIYHSQVEKQGSSQVSGLRDIFHFLLDGPRQP